MGPAGGRAGGKDARGVLRIGPLAFALFCGLSRQLRQLFDHGGRGEFDLTRGRAVGGFLPFGQTSKQPAFGLFRLGNVGLEHLRPRPAQALQRLERAPRAFAFEPFGIAAGGDQRARCALEHFWHPIVTRRHGQAQCLGQPARGRHAEPRGVDEGEGFEQIEPR